jgi:hypothetical protein
MRWKLLLILLLIAHAAPAQDSVLARKIIDTLASPRFWGRGYTRNGMAKAAAYLEKQLKAYGLKPMDGHRFMQPFHYPVNIFPGKMEVTINNQALVPGRDFIIGNESHRLKAHGTLIPQDKGFIDETDHLIISMEDKLTWSAEQKVTGSTLIQLNKNILEKPPENYKVNIAEKFLPHFKASNICAIVKGTAQPDSIIVFTAHYDHLGGMGNKVYFPGANDNASGVSLVLNMAKYYAQHPQPYTMAFILFGGEEAGLLGSRYFSEHPLIPLKNICFLVNLDLEGTGVEGITVVNATLYAKQFNLLQSINHQEHYLPKINSRGKAANSDHYFFTQKGVPAFYLYTLGGIKAYHDIYDVSATLPLTAYNHLFKLLLKFNDGLMNKGPN